MTDIADGLTDLLKTGRFEKITIDQWEVILLSIIVDNLEMDYAYKHKKLPGWIKSLKPYLSEIPLDLYDRDGTPITTAVSFFRDRLPTLARITLSDALTRYVNSAYEALVFSDYKNKQAETIVNHCLTISGLLDGAIRADVVEKMALDRKFKNRTMATGNLLNQSFRNSVSPDFWTRLESQVSWAPELAPYVMDQYMYNDQPLEALKVLKHVPREPENANVLRIIERALNASRACRGWKEHIINVFSKLPPWVTDLMHNEIGLDPVFKEVLDLLEVGLV